MLRALKESKSQEGITPAAAPPAVPPPPVAPVSTISVTQAIPSLILAAGPDHQSAILAKASAPAVAVQPETKTAPAPTSLPVEIETSSNNQVLEGGGAEEFGAALGAKSQIAETAPEPDQLNSATLPAGHPQQTAISDSLAHVVVAPPTAAPNNPTALAQPPDAEAAKLQVPANSANQAAPTAVHAELPLPNVATLIAASSDSVLSAKSAQENRQVIAQRIQTALPTLGQVGAVQSIQSSLDSTGNSSRQNSGSAPGQNGGHSPATATAQSSSQTHSTDDAKSSSSTDSSQSSSKDGNGAAAIAPQRSPTAAAPSNTLANAAATSQSAHVAVQAPAQADATAATFAKVPQESSAAANSSQSSQPMLPSLPRSLTDVSQATQLYQRVGGAEMHIAMDTDLLGSIDLRAVVHQGSLSATIGVQRADVQTLLVNELPALQHSLAEKNLQVGQISVLAGSVGGGANSNGHPQQQNRQNTNTQAAPAFPDDPPSFVSPAHIVEVAAARNNSARLSVLA